MSATPRTMSALLAVPAAGVLLLGMGLTACSSDDSSTDPAGAPVTVTVTADPPQVTVTQPPGDGNGGGTGGGGAPSPTDGDDGGTGEDLCDAGMTGADAVARWAGEVPLPADGYPWDPATADSSGYDPCAALSWTVLPIKDGTAASPYQIMLFHLGEYLGTATSRAYGFHPDIVRRADDQIQVTWHWPKEGESNAAASGTSVSHFRWSEEDGQVVMTGETPPYDPGPPVPR